MQARTAIIMIDSIPLSTSYQKGVYNLILASRSRISGEREKKAIWK